VAGIPRFRGVSHQFAFPVAVLAGCALAIYAPTPTARASAIVFAASVAAMFGASALYHRYPFKSAARRVWARRLDHSTIFLFIAGTYTPFALLAFNGTITWIVLATVWFGAALGLVLNFVWLDAPRWVSVLAYVAVGWVGIVTIPQMFSGVGIPGSVLVMVGGLLYSIGAVVYATHWPNPFPATFGFHEIFHLLVVVAAATQFVAVSLVVV
jgi:hemolysin III